MTQAPHAKPPTSDPLSVYVGWDPREQDAFDVCRFSLDRHASAALRIHPIRKDALVAQGLYSRPTETRDGQLWDVISGAPMSTEFAITRFFVPLLAKARNDTGTWAVFCDCDFLWTSDIYAMLDRLDARKALYCVQHSHLPTEQVKMDNQVQTQYSRKNWSSLMVFNLRHPAHDALRADVLNTVPGRDLHRFCWLRDEDIGGLDVTWNWLEGYSPLDHRTPHAIHFTRGGPWLPQYKNVTFGELWEKEFALLRQAR